MPIEPLDFLSFAQKTNELKTESAYRTVVSRSYYACYHYSQEMAAILDDVEFSGGVHAQHIKKFISAPNMKTKSIGYQLKQFHSSRIDADYELSMEITEDEAELALLTAQKIIEAIDELS